MCVESLMPKGVEHERIERDAFLAHASVESLMPKGVEHLLSIPSFLAESKCRISDAERR